MHFQAKEDIKEGQLAVGNLATGLISLTRMPEATISREVYEELERWIKKCMDGQTFTYIGNEGNQGVYYAVPHQILIDKLQSMLPDETRGEKKV